MRKLVSIGLALFFITAVTGCGSSSSTPPMTYQTAVTLVNADVSGKTFYSTTINGISTYQINADFTWSSTVNNTTASGKWVISSTGTLDLTPTGASIASPKFTCLQKETSYFLMSDVDSHSISRFYFDPIAAQTYLNSILISQSPLSVKLGGSIQGTSVFSNISSLTGHATSTFSNISTIAGHSTGTNLPAVYTGTSYTSYARGTDASFSQPNGLTTDGTSLFVADSANNMIRKVIRASGFVTTLAGSPAGIAGIADSTPNDDTGVTATFNLPTGITTDGTFLYVADTGNNAIRRVDPTTGATRWIAGSTAGVPGSVDAIYGTDSRFNQPTGITTDGTNLYVADSGNHTIRKIVIDSGAVTTLAGAAASPGSVDSAPTDINGANARFNQPIRITTDGSNLYVTDTKNSTIRKVVIATGKVTTIAGVAGAIGLADSIVSTSTVPAVAIATGATARFNQPNGITTDGTNLFITDSFNSTIRQMVIATGQVTTVPSIGSVSFFHPIGITTDGTSLFVADGFNSAIGSDNSTVNTYDNTIRRLR